MADKTTPVKWNPRYLCYATAHARSPEEQRAHDREAWPGGCAAGFILWNGDRLREFERENPDAFFNVWLMANHAHRDMLVMQPSYAGNAYTGEEEGELVDSQGLPLYPPDYWRECRSCQGTGRQTNIESAFHTYEDCFFCHGSGRRGIEE